jgi:hypothetical protein
MVYVALCRWLSATQVGKFLPDLHTGHVENQYGAEACHVATKHLYSEVRVVWTWLQDADDSLGDLHTLHCSQCSPRACSAPRLPSFIPKDSQHILSRCAWPGRGESVTELVPFTNFLVHSYTCCNDRHASPYWTFIRRWISMGFTPSLLKKKDDRTLFFVGACCKRGRHLYTTTALSCCIPASY